VIKLRLVIDPALQIVLSLLTGWLDRLEREAVAYLIASGATSSAARRTPQCSISERVIVSEVGRGME
jgi:hypothetical protein